MNRRLSACVGFAGLVALAACSDSAFEVTEPDFSGTVASIDARDAELATHLIYIDPPTPESDPVAPAASKVVWVNGSTIFGVWQRDGTVRRGMHADIRIGTRLRVETTGAEMRSLPPQYVAARVEVRP